MPRKYYTIQTPVTTSETEVHTDIFEASTEEEAKSLAMGKYRGGPKIFVGAPELVKKEVIKI